MSFWPQDAAARKPANRGNTTQFCNYELALCQGWIRHGMQLKFKACFLLPAHNLLKLWSLKNLIRQVWLGSTASVTEVLQPICELGLTNEQRPSIRGPGKEGTRESEETGSGNLDPLN